MPTSVIMADNRSFAEYGWAAYIKQMKVGEEFYCSAPSSNI